MDIKDLSEELSDYWNTRIIKHIVTGKYENGKKYKETYYGVHEVYYDKKDKPVMWTEKPIRFCFEDEEGLDAQMQQILDAKKRTVLKEKNEKITDTKKFIWEMK